MRQMATAHAEAKAVTNDGKGEPMGGYKKKKRGQDVVGGNHKSQQGGM